VKDKSHQKYKNQTGIGEHYIPESVWMSPLKEGLFPTLIASGWHWYSIRDNDSSLKPQCDNKWEGIMNYEAYALIRHLSKSR
jgi:hypothetical protein